MIRLIQRIGCAIILLILGAALWHFRDLWLPRVKAYLVDKAPEAIEKVVP